MDISKQYPNLTLNQDHASVFLVENLLSRLGLSVIDLMNYSRSIDRTTLENLSTRSGISADEIIDLFQAAKNLFIADLNPIDIDVLKPNIPTGLKLLDKALLGGITSGQITEVFGASGCGKSQFLLSLLVNAQTTGNVARNTCIYITTESTLESRRLHDFSHDATGSLDRVSYRYCQDLEEQDHMIFTQLRAKLMEDKVAGLNTQMVVIDSISHHLRAEDTFLNTLEYFRSHLEWQESQLQVAPSYAHEKRNFDSLTNQFLKGDSRFRKRTSKKFYLFTLFSHLALLAREFNVAVVLANQVSDAMEQTENNANEVMDFSEDPLDYEFQVGTFLGWNSAVLVPESVTESGEQTQIREEMCDYDAARTGNDIWKDESDVYSKPKRKLPALGYTWSKLITHRILLWKSYQPVLERAPEAALGTETTSNQNLNNNSNHGPGNENGYDTIELQSQGAQKNESAAFDKNPHLLAAVSGFKIHRFARVVLCGVSGGAPTAEFEISQDGLRQVQASDAACT